MGNLLIWVNRFMRAKNLQKGEKFVPLEFSDYMPLPHAISIRPKKSGDENSSSEPETICPPTSSFWMTDATTLLLRRRSRFQIVQGGSYLITDAIARIMKVKKALFKLFNEHAKDTRPNMATPRLLTALGEEYGLLTSRGQFRINNSCFQCCFQVLKIYGMGQRKQNPQ